MAEYIINKHENPSYIVDSFTDLEQKFNDYKKETNDLLQELDWEQHEQNKDLMELYKGATRHQDLINSLLGDVASLAELTGNLQKTLYSLEDKFMKLTLVSAAAWVSLLAFMIGVVLWN